MHTSLSNFSKQKQGEIKSKSFALRATLFFCLSALLPAGHSYSQTDDIRFEHITIEDGLSQSAVFVILQDSKGFMWFGTKDGLNKYDGYSFTIYEHDPFDSTTISHNYIKALFEDSGGDLWVGTLDGGLNRMNRQTETFQRFLHDPENPQSLSSNNITAIVEDKHGNLWVGTADGGLNFLDRTNLALAKPVFITTAPSGTASRWRLTAVSSSNSRTAGLLTVRNIFMICTPGTNSGHSAAN